MIIVSGLVCAGADDELGDTAVVEVSDDGELAGADVVVSDDGAGTSTGDGDCGAGGIDELGMVI